MRLARTIRTRPRNGIAISEDGRTLVFSEAGELIGALNATLGPLDSQQQQRLPGNTFITTGPKVLGNQQNYGPSQLTVAYTAGAQVMTRVLSGFLSPAHDVAYPSLGVMCIDSPGGGATVQAVTKNSPAAKANFRVGDIILDIGGKLIQNQVDFARVMLEQAVDQKVTIRVRRGAQQLLLEPVIVKAED